MIIKPLLFQSSGALGVLQFATSHPGDFEYVPADIAMKNKWIEVRETSEAGSVNSLIVLNSSDSFVFLMDGDILAGAKQNRVLNTSVLLAPKSKTVIPVSCVESGRWRRVSDTFASTDYSAPSLLRKKKSENVTESLRVHQQFDAKQHQVWQDVAHYSMMGNIHSPTMSFSDVFEGKRRDVDEQLKAFDADPGANGVVFFHGKAVIEAECFGCRNVFGHYFPKLLKGTVMEELFEELSGPALTEAEARFRMEEFLDGWEAVPKDSHPGAGLGTELRAADKNYSGMQLMYNDHLIHCSVFNSLSRHKKD